MHLDSAQDRRLSELLLRAQEGDRDAYEAFLRDAVVLVRDFVRWRLREPAEAEDVVQDVLLALHRYRHTYDPQRPVAPWLYAIARHRLVDAIKSRQRRARMEQPDRVDSLGYSEVANIPTPPAVADTPGLGGLERAFLLLSGAQREVIHLLKFEGYSVAEIAKKTGRSPSAVKVTAHRGYKLLRKALKGPLGDY